MDRDGTMVATSTVNFVVEIKGLNTIGVQIVAIIKSIEFSILFL